MLEQFMGRFSMQQDSNKKKTARRRTTGSTTRRKPYIDIQNQLNTSM
jgi:hypothetical protein